MISLPFFPNVPPPPLWPAMQCPPGYTRFQISSSPLRWGCRPIAGQYQLYGPQYFGWPPFDPYMQTSPAACVGGGGLWDSFANACASGVDVQQYYQPNPIQNVIGLDKWGAVSALNGQGYEVWLLQEDGIFGGNPPGYNPRRADIVVQSGRVVAVQVG